jgi:hypothetical protein
MDDSALRDIQEDLPDLQIERVHLRHDVRDEPNRGRAELLAQGEAAPTQFRGFLLLFVNE